MALNRYYHTQSFEEFIPPLAYYYKGQAKEENKAFVELATSLGQAFEGIFYEKLSALAGDKGKMDSISSNALYRLKQANAIATFKGLALEQPDIAKMLDTVKEQAERLAQKTHNRIVEEMLNNTQKTYSVEQIGGKKDEKVVGDIRATVEGRVVIFECKYQIYEGAQVRYEQLVEETLFHGKFKQFLAEDAEKGKNSKYWNFSKTPQQWTYVMRQEALGAFIGDKPFDFFNYILQKGVKEGTYQKKEIIYASNLIDGGETLRAETILDLEALSQYVKKNDVYFEADKKAYFKIMVAKQEEEIGRFGMSRFEADKVGRDPTAADYQFEMYLAQKLFVD